VEKEVGATASTIEAQILKKLRRRGNWAGSHTGLDDIPKSFPKDRRGSVKDSARELIKKDLLLKKPTGYGDQVSLNPNRKKDIEKIIRDVLGE